MFIPSRHISRGKLVVSQSHHLSSREQGTDVQSKMHKKQKQGIWKECKAKARNGQCRSNKAGSCTGSGKNS